MSRSLNKVQLIGNLGADPEVRSTTNGSRVATLSIATSRQWTGKGGDKQEKTEWHRVVLWNTNFNKLADIAEKYCKKGDKVYVEGAHRVPHLAGPRGTDPVHHRDQRPGAHSPRAARAVVPTSPSAHRRWAQPPPPPRRTSPSTTSPRRSTARTTTCRSSRLAPRSIRVRRPGVHPSAAGLVSGEGTALAFSWGQSIPPLMNWSRSGPLSFYPTTCYIVGKTGWLTAGGPLQFTANLSGNRSASTGQGPPWLCAMH